jgi:tRNA G18 (ribose-2'-O)-methylase SpoU
VQSVTDFEDARLEPYRDLRRGERAGIVVEGHLAVARYLDSDFPVHSLLATPAQLDRLAAKVPADTEVFVADKGMIERIVGFEFHRGCLAHGPTPPARDLRADIAGLAEFAIVALEGLSDPVNVGTIIRTARALGATGVLLDQACADPLSRRAVRASMGNAFALPWWTVPDLTGSLEQLRTSAALTLVAGSPDPGATSLGRWTPRPRTVLLMGNEGSGLSPGLLDLADARVRIPIVPQADSLNVAAATAVLLYGLLPEQNA